MSNVTRRGFLRTASISAAAMGVLTAMPAIAQTAEPGASPQGMPLPAGSMAPAAPPIGGGSAAIPMVVYFADPASGQGVIFAGEREIRITDPALVKSLQALLAA